MVIRYIISNIDKDDMRSMTYPCQGRNTRGSKQEAQKDLQDFLSANTEDQIVRIFGKQAAGTFEVSAVECYDGHFDPVGVFVKEELNPGQVCAIGRIAEVLEMVRQDEARNNKKKEAL